MNRWMSGYGNDAVPIGASHLVVENQTINIWDTYGGDEYSLLRPLAYQNTDLFLVCFPLYISKENTDTPSLFAEAIHKFITEVRQNASKIPCILVGMKKDMANCVELKEKYLFLRPMFGEYVARETGCLAYVETSAKTAFGCDQLKRAIVRVPTSKKSCLFQ
jgi:GTPase SAR1 family protein